MVEYIIGVFDMLAKRVIAILFTHNLRSAFCYIIIRVMDSFHSQSNSAVVLPLTSPQASAPDVQLNLGRIVRDNIRPLDSSQVNA
jgi:hypothetical protein